MKEKIKYIKEYSTWSDSLINQLEMDKSTIVKDSFYQMELLSIKYLNKSETEMVMTVLFSEVNNPQYNGKGTFKYYHSDIPGSTDVIPTDLKGILLDIQDEDPQILYDFLREIYDKINV